jgi:hypothetical protein
MSSIITDAAKEVLTGTDLGWQEVWISASLRTC